MTASTSDLYRYVREHLRSVPPVFYDRVRTALLLKGVDLLGEDQDLMFVALRNKKIDTLRSCKRDRVTMNSVKTSDVTESELLPTNGKTDMRSFLEILYITFLRVNPPHQRYLSLYIRAVANGKQPTNEHISFLAGFNGKRGSVIWKKIKETALQVQKEGRAYELYRVRDLSDLLRRVRLQ